MIVRDTFLRVWKKKMLNCIIEYIHNIIIISARIIEIPCVCVVNFVRRFILQYKNRCSYMLLHTKDILIVFNMSTKTIGNKNQMYIWIIGTLFRCGVCSSLHVYVDIKLILETALTRIGFSTWIQCTFSYT